MRSRWNENSGCPCYDPKVWRVETIKQIEAKDNRGVQCKVDKKSDRARAKVIMAFLLLDGGGVEQSRCLSLWTWVCAGFAACATKGSVRKYIELHEDRRYMVGLSLISPNLVR